jgi:hypothetical protein
VDWRWGRAEELASGRGRRQGWDDEPTLAAQRFIARWSRVGGELAGPGLAGEDAAISGAVQLRHGQPRRRWELEARILARQTDEEIGSKLGVPAPVVAAYEGLFFSVRVKFAATDWIMANVIGPRAYEGTTEDDVELIWKLWGFWGGPMVLDALIAHNEAGRGGPTEGLDPTLARACERIVAVTALSPFDDPLGVLRLEALHRQFEAGQASDDVARASRPVAIDPADVRIDPEPARLVRAGCAPGAAGSVPFEEIGPDPALDSVVEPHLRSTG